MHMQEAVKPYNKKKSNSEMSAARARTLLHSGYNPLWSHREVEVQPPCKNSARNSTLLRVNSLLSERHTKGPDTAGRRRTQIVTSDLRN